MMVPQQQQQQQHGGAPAAAIYPSPQFGLVPCAICVCVRARAYIFFACIARAKKKIKKICLQIARIRRTDTGTGDGGRPSEVLMCVVVVFYFS